MAEVSHVEPPDTPQEKTHAPSDVEDTRYFDFFGLPRELRDRVYAEVDGNYAIALVGDAVDISSWELKEVREGDVLGLECSAAPRTTLLSVSKQFAAEYEEEVLRCARLEVCFVTPSSRGHSVPLAQNPTLQRQTARVRDLSVDVAHYKSHDGLNSLGKCRGL